jgi:hypothetical protein
MYYSLSLKELAAFSDLNAAAKSMHGQLHRLVAVIEGKFPTYNNFYWRRGMES